jgi:hypothetical protein
MKVLNRPQVIKKISTVYKPKQNFNNYKGNHIQQKNICVSTISYCPVMGLI